MEDGGVDVEEGGEGVAVGAGEAEWLLVVVVVVWAEGEVLHVFGELLLGGG